MVENEGTVAGAMTLNDAIFLWLNRLNGSEDWFGKLLNLSQTDYLKSVPFMLIFWALWFVPGVEVRTAIRERLVAVLLSAVAVIVITRVLANSLPFSVRPLHSGIALVLGENQSTDVLDGWSSMPSDHASLFMGLAVAIMMVHRTFGLLLVAWAVVVVSLPRIVMGYHWPADVAAGWLLGASVAFVLQRPLTAMVRSAGIVPFFESREALGYPLLFLATFEVARMFWFSRFVVLALVE